MRLPNVALIRQFSAAFISRFHLDTAPIVSNIYYIGFGGTDPMNTPSKTISPSQVEEQFLLAALRRLQSPEQRYIFTLMADLISHGLAAQDRKTENP